MREPLLPSKSTRLLLSLIKLQYQTGTQIMIGPIFSRSDGTSLVLIVRLPNSCLVDDARIAVDDGM